jgi:hypothetical protein
MSCTKRFFNNFEKVLCVNLPGSSGRRYYIEKLFDENGLDQPVFFQATDQGSNVVDDYYKAGLVKGYPNCFRCEKKTSNEIEFNNILIRPQVATFITYLNIWKFILDNGIQNALIIEDDIAFNEDIEAKCSQIDEKRLIESTGLQGSESVLIRFGWALGQEHSQKREMQFIQNMVRMSNPCFAVNRSMAGLLHSSCAKISTTADIYTHEVIGRKVKNYTAVPPLFYEKSWSTGEFESLIHPKFVRLDYLEKTSGKDSSIYEDAHEKYSKHIKHIHFFPLLVIGHPRCGSGYMSKLLAAFSLDLGHEKIGGDGISSWMFSVDDEEYPFYMDEHSSHKKNKYFKYKICYIRNPIDAIPSIVRENNYSSASYEFRRKHIISNFNIDLNDFNSSFQKAVASYVFWYKYIFLQGVDITIRVENDEKKLKWFLFKKMLLHHLLSIKPLPEKNINKTKPYKGKVYEKEIFSFEDWLNLPPILVSGINDICITVGYKSPFLKSEKR